MQRAFIIRPFGTRPDRKGRMINFDRVQANLIEPALTAAKLDGGTTGQINEAGNIREDMFGLILEADIVVCDMTIHNANVFYELGIRHALRRRRSVLIRGADSADDVPFDNLTDRYLPYDVDKPEKSVEELTSMLKISLKNGRTDSPVFNNLRDLPEPDPALVQVLPQELSEEVERARAARSAGLLRLLSQEVESRRFQWAALRLIGRAQWDIEDSDGARRTYQKLIDNDPNDLEANNALANLYERQYRRDKRNDILAASDQAIRRVLANSRATREQCTEAESLIRRNTKTRWRQTFERFADDNERRKAATNRQLIEAYNAHLGAYSGDLKSCIAALQMCTIAKCLAVQEEAWAEAFDDDGQAEAKKKELPIVFEQLTGAVKLALQAAQKKLPAGSDERKMVDICNADLLFLTEPKDARVKNAYEGCLPLTPGLVSEANAQLEVFAKLGIKTTLADEIMTKLGPVGDPPPAVVILAGHRVDEPGYASDRFPEGAVAAVEKSLHEKLMRLKESAGGAGIHVLASAAPGAEIICHELCLELGIKSTICLPMPVDSYSTNTFKEDYLDPWRRRFLALVRREGADCQQLTNARGLPNWLEGTGIDEWERGNNWVLQLALSAGTPNMSVIAVLGGSTIADAKGGTAHMVEIARAAGILDVEVIKLKDGEVVPEGS